MPSRDERRPTSAGGGTENGRATEEGGKRAERPPSRTVWGPVVVYLKGFAMGSAATVPGVSAGTIALIAGIYDRFIRALTLLDGRLLGLATGLHRPAGRDRFREAARERDLPFLLVLLAGVGTAVLTLARLLSTVLDVAPGPMFAFFGGLIGASAVVLFDREWVRQPPHLIAAIGGFALAVVVATASGVGLFPATLPMVFVAAAIAISGMVLPGLSGSFLLLLLGQFERLAGVAGRVPDHAATLATGRWPEQFLADGAVVVAFGLGAAVGFFTTAHAVRAALERAPGVTLAFLVSLMVGGLALPVVRILEATTADPLAVTGLVLSGGAGAGAVFLFDRYTQDLAYGSGGAERTAGRD